jgi:GMP synthase (glutamine-hydrolysing)
MKPKAVILSGGPESVHEEGLAARAAGDLRGRRAGARHLLRPAGHGAQLGGEVEGGHHREFGRADVEVTGARARCSTASGKGERIRSG